eukprot:TRINITY_DN21270_c1_g2_i1.p1 TRINITY_DN21270_c1_g2~~TRINITY_DN21270_c1_g2_i1.p1  ORF type:complete len:780 (-),score=150.64 TRINITY_DN21270_c1_g2_i1:401-2740(-)
MGPRPLPWASQGFDGSMPKPWGAEVIADGALTVADMVDAQVVAARVDVLRSDARAERLGLELAKAQAAAEDLQVRYRDSVQLLDRVGAQNSELRSQVATARDEIAELMHHRAECQLKHGSLLANATSLNAGDGLLRHKSGAGDSELEKWRRRCAELAAKERDIAAADPRSSTNSSSSSGDSCGSNGATAATAIESNLESSGAPKCMVAGDIVGAPALMRGFAFRDASAQFAAAERESLQYRVRSLEQELQSEKRSNGLMRARFDQQCAKLEHLEAAESAAAAPSESRAAPAASVASVAAVAAVAAVAKPPATTMERRPSVTGVADAWSRRRPSLASSVGGEPLERLAASAADSLALRQERIRAEELEAERTQRRSLEHRMCRRWEEECSEKENALEESRCEVAQLRTHLARVVTMAQQPQPNRPREETASAMRIATKEKLDHESQRAMAMERENKAEMKKASAEAARADNAESQRVAVEKQVNEFRAKNDRLRSLLLGDELGNGTDDADGLERLAANLFLRSQEALRDSAKWRALYDKEESCSENLESKLSALEKKPTVKSAAGGEHTVSTASEERDTTTETLRNELSRLQEQLEVATTNAQRSREQVGQLQKRLAACNSESEQADVSKDLPSIPIPQQFSLPTLEETRASDVADGDTCMSSNPPDSPLSTKTAEGRLESIPHRAQEKATAKVNAARARVTTSAAAKTVVAMVTRKASAKLAGANGASPASPGQRRLSGQGSDLLGQRRLSGQGSDLLAQRRHSGQGPTTPPAPPATWK